MSKRLEPDPADETSDPAPRRAPFFESVRFRLAFRYSALVLLMAVVVLGIVNVAVSRTLRDEPVSIAREYTTILDPVTGRGITLERDIRLGATEATANRGGLNDVRRMSLWALLGMFPASVAIGWFVADRALRPIGAIAVIARDIERTDDLSRRVDLEGRDDEMKDVADAVDSMLDRIEQSVASQRALVEDISHELRNPLAVMATSLDVVLAEENPTVEDLKHVAAVVRRTVDRAARTVDDLVVLGRDGIPGGRRTSVDLGVLIEEALDEHRGPIEAARLSVEVHIGPAIVGGDLGALKSAVANLVGNAVRLSRPGSVIRAGAGSLRDFAWAGVDDDGPGLDPRDHELAFRRSWSGDGSSLGGEGRSGLGLPIARQIAELHGGLVTVDSERGAGAEFVIWIPVSPDADASGVSIDGIHPLASPLRRRTPATTAG